MSEYITEIDETSSLDWTVISIALKMLDGWQIIHQDHFHSQNYQEVIAILNEANKQTSWGKVISDIAIQQLTGEDHEQTQIRQST